MKIDLSTVLNTEAERLSFEGNLDFSDRDIPGGVRPFKSPVSVWGEVKNIAGTIMLNMNISADLSCECDRCLKPFTRRMELSFEADLVTEIHDETCDDLILIEENKLDIEALAYEHILLEIPAKHLCSLECKGLCPVCGTDLNMNTCNCDTRAVDPRLEALKKFFS